MVNHILALLNMSLIWVLGVAKKQDLKILYKDYPAMLITCPRLNRIANPGILCLTKNMMVAPKLSSHPMTKQTT